MDQLSGNCAFFNLEKVIFGPGKVGLLGDELGRLGGRRAVLATGRTLGASSLLYQVRSAMGDRCVGIFTGAAQHAPAETAEALAAEMRRLDADSIVSFGGGSPIDTAKVAVAAVLSGRRVEDMATMEIFDITDLGANQREFPHITLPTTLSAGEYTHGAAATDANGVKGSVMNARLQIKVVINDPELTLETPDELWVSTGVRALDHIVEAFYSNYRQSFTNALAAEGLKLLLDNLLLSISALGAERLVHRGLCQAAAFLSNYAAINTRYGLSHAVGHKIGPKWGIPHGVTSCISLPFAMRFMADRVPERFDKLAAALSLGFDSKMPEAGAMACIARIEGFIDSLGMPRSLAEVGVSRDRLDDVIDNIHHEITLLDAVGGEVSRDSIKCLMREMY